MDENPTRRRAWLTIALILVNVGVFVLIQQRQPTSEAFRFGDDQVVIDGTFAFDLEHAAIPCEVTSGEPLDLAEVIRPGDDACRDPAPGVPQLFPDKHVALALVVSMFLHGGWLHLAANMLFLWIFGNNIEDHMGAVRYAGFYVLGGLVAALAHVAVQPASTIPVVGASGAIAAVMGAYLVWFPDAPVRALVVVFIMDIRARWLLAGWFVLQFFTGDDAGVAWVAHVGGFVFGVVVGLLVRRSAAARRLLWRREYARPQPTWDPTGGAGRGPYPHLSDRRPFS